MLGGLWLLFFGPQLVSSGVPYYRDHLVTNIPLRAWVRERLLAGAFPHWYPYEGLGVPVIGQIALATFHPFTFLFLPLAPTTAEKASILGAYLVGLLGAYRLGRAVGASREASVAGAAAYAFGGYALGVSSILAYALSASAFPWVAWAMLQVAQRGRLKDAGLLGLLWGTVFLSGDAISFALCGALFAPVALLVAPRWRTAWLVGLGGMVAALLCCVELLPSTRVAAQAVRVVGLPSPTIGLHWALHPWRLPELVLPGYLVVRSRMVGELFHDGSAVFATSVFAGGLTLVLAAAGLATRRRLSWAFGAVALLGVVLALGDRGGLLALLRQTWLFARFRYPERYLVCFWLGLVPLVALGVDEAVAHARRWALVFLGTAGTFCALAAAVVSFGAASRVWALAGAHLDSEDPLAALLDNRWCAGLLWTAGFALLGWAALRLGGPRRGGVLLAAALFLELWHGNGGQLPLVPPALLTERTAFSTALQSTAHPPEPPARVFHTFEPDFPSSVTGPMEERERWVRGMRHVLGWDVAGLEHLPTLHVNLGATTVRHTLLLRTPETLALRAPALNGCFRVDDVRRPAGPRASLLASAPDLGLTLSSIPCTPRAFLAGTTALPGPEAVARWLGNGPLPTEVVPWEGGPPLARANGTVTWGRADPEHLTLEVVAESPTALVVTDEYAEGWTATLDGQPVAIHPTLLAARGVEVPAGRHRVEFLYRTPRFTAGLALTLLGLACGLAFIASGLRPRPRPWAGPGLERPGG
ncbi:MAG: YfhO family protein [Myxococcaceae bacterium]